MAVTRSRAILADRHPQALESFKEGLGSVLRQWTALELAVYHQWGGPTSSIRAEKLQEELIELFMSPDKVYKDDISLLLEEYLECEFNTICEDGSPDELGELIVNMWRECCTGSFNLVTDVLAREFVRHEMISRSQGICGKGDIADDADDDVDTTALEQVVHEEVMQLPTLDSIMETEEAPELVDPDGWEKVQRSKKSKKKQYKI